MPKPHHRKASPKNVGTPPVAVRERAAASASRSRRVRRRRSQLPLAWLIGFGALALLVVGQIVVNAVDAASLPGERFASQGNVHVALGTVTPPYNSDPPTSGWHTQELAPWGSHLEPLPDQMLVHNMEDGGVILWYAQGAPEENARHVAALQEIAGSYRSIVIVPRADMPTTYAFTAWQRLQRFDDIEPDAMRAFIAAYHGRDNHR